MAANKMTADEFRNMMAQNHYDDDDIEIKSTGDCFVDGLKLMSEYLGSVHVKFLEDGVVWTERVERLIAHNISYDDVRRLQALGWYVEYENSTMVAFQLTRGEE